jgi:UDP-glucuronate 4-epimerase
MLGHVHSHIYGTRFIALRLFTVYGPAQRPDLAIHKFTKAILQEEPIPVYGDGSSSRDYTYVDDIVNGILAAMHYDRSLFEIINLGNNDPVSLSSLIGMIEKVMGKKAFIKTLPDQPGDVHQTFADISKAKRLLNYEPQVQLEEGLQRFYNWFLENKEIVLA